MILSLVITANFLWICLGIQAVYPSARRVKGITRMPRQIQTVAVKPDFASCVQFYDSELSSGGLLPPVVQLLT